VAAPHSSPLLGASPWQTIESASIAVTGFTTLHALLCFLVLTLGKFVVRLVLQQCLWFHRFFNDSYVPSQQICEVAGITVVAMVAPLPLYFFVLPPGGRFQCL
jgi:hypothetical protein